MPEHHQRGFCYSEPFERTHCALNQRATYPLPALVDSHRRVVDEAAAAVVSGEDSADKLVIFERDEAGLGIAGEEFRNSLA